MTIKERKEKLDENLRIKQNLLAAEIKAVEQDYYAAARKIEEDCVTEHGSHEDDGGFMHGFCTRCGAFLG